MTKEQKRDLDFVVLHNGIRIYTPTQRSLDRYGPLSDLGYVTIDDVGSDQDQETILRVRPTEAGRKALAS
jgi:hypothetical protein